jgi:hypothetical protein
MELGDAIRDLGGRLPAGLLPIAADLGGNIICISLRETDEGTVYYWDWYGQFPDPRPPDANVYPIAESFERFLKSLYTGQTGA